MEANTHRGLSRALCGTPRRIEVGCAEVELITTDAMRADAHGLVHGGFVFGLADHAAMLAINAETVVLGSAEVRFLAPVTVSETLHAIATVASVEGKRHFVQVKVARGETPVMEGTFTCFVPARHVLAATSEGRPGSDA